MCRPGQVSSVGHHEADAFARTRRRETKHMLRPIMAQIVAARAAEHDAVGAEQSGVWLYRRFGPSRRTRVATFLRLPRPETDMGWRRQWIKPADAAMKPPR